MRVYERFIASECPPENGSVLWIDTSREHLSLKILSGNEWKVLSYDQQALEKIIKILGDFTNPNETVAADLEYIRGFLTEATEEEIYAMFPVTSNNE